MPRYFFDYRNGDRLSEDFEGEMLSGMAAVEETAMASAKEIIADGLLGGEPVLTGYAYEIRDEARNLVLVFPFSEAAAKQGARP
jgi:hypothetical protein